MWRSIQIGPVAARQIGRIVRPIGFFVPDPAQAYAHGATDRADHLAGHTDRDTDDRGVGDQTVERDAGAVSLGPVSSTFDIAVVSLVDLLDPFLAYFDQVLNLCRVGIEGCILKAVVVAAGIALHRLQAM